ncbi:hypothetical protein ABIA52_003422 [Paenarthrobacter histidinolovorans]|uniref:Uncharacterized protein n=1 Tax=Paenarthrobacter histidinolovorans TaxID=43664 RepID=A0ABW8NAD5_9MICC
MVLGGATFRRVEARPANVGKAGSHIIMADGFRPVYKEIVGQRLSLASRALESGKFAGSSLT